MERIKQLRLKGDIVAQEAEDLKCEFNARQAGDRAYLDYLHSEYTKKNLGFTPLIVDPSIYLLVIYHIHNEETAKYKGAKGKEKLIKIMYEELERLKNMSKFN